ATVRDGHMEATEVDPVGLRHVVVHVPRASHDVLIRFFCGLTGQPCFLGLAGVPAAPPTQHSSSLLPRRAFVPAMGSLARGDDPPRTPRWPTASAGPGGRPPGTPRPFLRHRAVAPGRAEPAISAGRAGQRLDP